MKAHYALAALLAVTLSAPLSGFAADKAPAKAAKPASAMAGKGMKCGDSYIAAGKTCSKTAAKPAMAAAPMKPVMAAKPAARTRVAAAKPAGKGVKCGNSYIAAGKTCHK